MTDRWPDCGSSITVSVRLQRSFISQGSYWISSWGESIAHWRFPSRPINKTHKCSSAGKLGFLLPTALRYQRNHIYLDLFRVCNSFHPASLPSMRTYGCIGCMDISYLFIYLFITLNPLTYLPLPVDHSAPLCVYSQHFKSHGVE